jgi:hypothetical protein
VKTANNTPAGALRGQATNSPRGLYPEASVLAEEPAGTSAGTLQPPPAPTVPPDTIVTMEDFQSSDAILRVSRSMLRSASVLLLLLGVMFW